MRTLVEQTEESVRGWLSIMGRLWDGHDTGPDGLQQVGVHVLMGGTDAGDWHLRPEAPAVLIGTQDMLLSRALNRGYGASRARWPMEMGLLNQDSLWVLDEVQLMDVGLATSVQLQTFRTEDEARALRPSRCWWMSATLQPGWLRTTDSAPMLDRMPDALSVRQSDRSGALWAVTKRLTVVDVPDDDAIARLALELHAEIEAGDFGQISLVVLNTVDRARDVFASLEKRIKGRADAPELRLVHSRFRGHERSAWRDSFLSRKACTRGVNRIIVATQVVEAGVDISAQSLVTEVAPWSSLVQRFGRVARYGGSGAVTVVVRGDMAKKPSPYALDDLTAALDWALRRLTDVSQASLEDFEADLSPSERARLYPYAPLHLLLRQEYDQLFDTTADLTGADLDISRFIRTGEDRDVQVFWADWQEGEPPSLDVQPVRADLCPVPVSAARKWLVAGKVKATAAEVNDAADGDEAPSSRGRGDVAFVVDYVDGGWKSASERDLIPGRTVLVRRRYGGYAETRGFTGKATDVPSERADAPRPPSASTRQDQGDRCDGADQQSEGDYQTIATHGQEVGRQTRTIATALGLSSDLGGLLNLAGRWHDVGKAHNAFRGSIVAATAPQRADLAKAPPSSWASPNAMYQPKGGGARRRGFRHELASTLALFDLLSRAAPDHPALGGEFRAILAAAGFEAQPGEAVESSVLTEEIAALGESDFDLVAYLVCSHHGKVRASLHSSPADQEFPEVARRGQPIRGVCDGDTLPAMPLFSALDVCATLPETQLSLELAVMGLSARFGRSWRERTLALQARFGPSGLAYLEALFRTADVRASQTRLVDPLIGDAR